MIRYVHANMLCKFIIKLSVVHVSVSCICMSACNVELIIHAVHASTCCIKSTTVWYGCNDKRVSQANHEHDPMIPINFLFP